MNVTRDAIIEAEENDQATTCVVLAERWLRDHSDDLEVIDIYAEVLFGLTRYDEAIRVYTTAIEKFIEDRWAIYNRLGLLYGYRGDFPESEKWHRKAAEEDPNQASSFILLGSIQFRQGNWKAAEASHRKAIQCSEGSIDEAYCNLGKILRVQERFDEAAECFRKAIEIDPEDENAIQALKDVTHVVTLLE